MVRDGRVFGTRSPRFLNQHPLPCRNRPPDDRDAQIQERTAGRFPASLILLRSNRQTCRWLAHQYRYLFVFTLLCGA